MADLGSRWAQGVASTNQDKFCRRQVQQGVSPQVCAQRFANWQADVAGKQQAYVQGYQNGR